MPLKALPVLEFQAKKFEQSSLRGAAEMTEINRNTASSPVGRGQWKQNT